MHKPICIIRMDRLEGCGGRDGAWRVPLTPAIKRAGAALVDVPDWGIRCNFLEVRQVLGTAEGGSPILCTGGKSLYY